MIYSNTSLFSGIAFVAGLALMLTFETFHPRRNWDVARLRRFFFHIGLAVFNGVVLYFTVSTIFQAWRNIVYDSGWGMASLLKLKGPLGIFVTVVVLDMFDYWWHRFNHQIRFLWRFHKVHHVDTHVDVTTSLRFHFGELIISNFVKALWLLILGPTYLGFAVFESTLTMAAQFHHSNIDFSDAKEHIIRKVFVTPRFHAAHHTVARRTGDANYSAIFIFWDKIFGTYREPDFEEMKTLGLSRGRESYLSFKETLQGPFLSKY